MSVWIDVVTRVRALSGGLPTDRQLAAFGRSRDVGALASRLVFLGVPPLPAESPCDPRLLVQRTHGRAGAALRLVAHWSAQRAALLAPLFEDEDCRSLRTLLRGARDGMASSELLPSLVPTPTLPFRMLAALAESRGVVTLVSRLAASGNPYGLALLPEVGHGPTDFVRVDAVLARTFAERGRRSAARGGRAMRTFVARVADLANVHTALHAAGHGLRGTADALFVEGGEVIPREAFLEALALGSRREATMMLLPFVRTSPLEAAVANEPLPDERQLRALIREQREIARLDPMGPAPIIEFGLRLRYTLLAIERTIWSLVAASAVPTYAAVVG